MKSTLSKFLWFFAGALAFPLAIYLYLAFGRPPVATADTPFPFEAKIIGTPLAARIQREMPASSPIPATDENLDAGAGIYEDKCEMCHGAADQPSVMARSMFPRPPQMWIRQPNGVLGVGGDPVGATYWKVRNGIRLSGMPAYGKALSETQLWQVSLLLSMADKPLPPDASKAVGR